MIKVNSADVSLIIVNWNTKDLLLACINSLIETSRNCNIEIIVVDNGSTDGSAEAVRDRFPDIQLILNRENLGFAKANNIGIRQSNGRYVCLVNSDIKALDECVLRMHDYMNSHPGIGALGPKTVGGDLKLRLNCRDFPTLWKIFCEALMLNRIYPKLKFFRGRLITDIDHDAAQSVDVLSGCFLMIRREVIEQIGMLDDRFYIYGEDRDWCKRIHSAGWDVVFYPGALAIHYGGGSSSAAPVKFLIEMLKSDFIYWEKHHPKPKLIFFGIIILMGYIVRICGNFLLLILKNNKRTTFNNLIKNYRCFYWIIKNKMGAYCVNKFLRGKAPRENRT